MAAAGVADAEHQVEKELRRLWPEARVEVDEISRSGTARIVEEFAIRYRLEGALDVVAPSVDDAPGAAFRHLRGMLAGGRYRRTEWEAVKIVSGPE